MGDVTTCRLPIEIEHHILLYVTEKDRKVCRLVCTNWREILLRLEYEFWIEFSSINRLVETIDSSLFAKKHNIKPCPAARLRIRKKSATLIAFVQGYIKNDLVISLFDLEDAQYVVLPTKEKMYQIPWTLMGRLAGQKEDSVPPRTRIYQRNNSTYVYFETMMSNNVVCSVRIPCYAAPVFPPSAHKYRETLIMRRLKIDESWGNLVALTVKPKDGIDMVLKISDGVTSYRVNYESSGSPSPATEKQVYYLPKEFLNDLFSQNQHSIDLQLGGPYRSIFCVKCCKRDLSYFVMYYEGPADSE